MTLNRSWHETDSFRHGSTRIFADLMNLTAEYAENAEKEPASNI
jgi:hypothetical protein